MIVQQPTNLAQWWTTFNDPELNSLVARALETNLDLEAAAERIHAARDTLGIAKGGLLPTVNAG